MKKSLLAIVLLAGGITFVTAQKKENVKLQKAPKTETVQKAEVKADMQSEKVTKAEAVEQKAEAAEMKTTEPRKVSDDTINTQKARKEIVE